MNVSSGQGRDAGASWLGDRGIIAAIVVAALGYFVDIYDLILFGVVRDASLADLGVAPAAIASEGIFLFNMQMGGMLLGGVLWGVLGDKRGRLSVLFGSIVMYSLANLANGMVDSLGAYATCRLVAGIGLAGELGAGVTLVAELMPRRSRGWGTTMVAFVGVLGCLFASFLGGGLPSVFHGVHWRTAYFIGGGLGLALLLLRVGVAESGIFARVHAQAEVGRGEFWKLFTQLGRLRRYLSVIIIGVPIWYVIGILVLNGASMAREQGMSPPPSTATALFYCYAGLAVGDLAAGAISQLLASRRKAFALFLGFLVAAMAVFFTFGMESASAYFLACALLGVGGGYWAVFVTSAAEQFGTNLRATVATTAPNFVRGAVVPVSMAYKWLADLHGATLAALSVGIACVVMALGALLMLKETFGTDLDYLEPL